MDAAISPRGAAADDNRMIEDITGSTVDAPPEAFEEALSEYVRFLRAVEARNEDFCNLIAGLEDRRHRLMDTLGVLTRAGYERSLATRSLVSALLRDVCAIGDDG